MEMQGKGPGKDAIKSHEKGMTFYGNGELENALVQFDRAVMQAPKWDKAYYCRAMALCCVKEYEEGIKDFNRVINLNPDHVDAHFYKGYAYIYLGKPAEATMALVKALRIDPSRRYILDSLACIWSDGRKPNVMLGGDSTPQVRYSPDRKHIDVSFDENDREQCSPTMRCYPAEERDLSTVALPPEASRYIAKVKSIFTHLDAARGCGLKKPVGVLLEGPNGTGKTELAFSLAGELGWNIVTASFGSISSKWVGQTEGNLVRIFRTLREKDCLPAVVLFDEIDSMVRSKDSDSRSWECSIINTFLTEINKLNNEHGADQIFIVGTTNHVEMIDPSVIRRGRLDCLEMPLPSVESREQIFRIHLRDRPVEEDLDFGELARMTEGCSGADIAGFANEASYRLFESMLGDSGRRTIGMEILEGIIKEQMPLMERPAGYA